MAAVVGGRGLRFTSLLGLLLAAALLAVAFAPAPGHAAGADVAKKKGAKKKGGSKKYKGPRIKTPNAKRCDFLDTSVCLHPWPNNLYLERDKGTDTGYRVDLHPKSMPQNVGGTGIDPTDHNRNDGFSPGQAIVLHVPGLDNQAAFERSGIVPIDDIRDYKRKKQPVVVIDKKTKKRHPIFAEIDANPAANDDRNLIIRPLENWEEGHRYIVALRKLVKNNGREIKPPKAFKVYRDKLITKQKKVEERRKYFEKKIFKPIKKAKKLGRKGLYMAWDFTVASADNLAGRVLAMRDDAFERLGDTDLADRTVQGSSPGYTITDSIENPQAEILRRVEGTIDDVPCYLDQNGCPPGAKFEYESKRSTTPTWDPSYTVDVPFECNIPNSIDTSSTVDPGRPAIYGHGLLGNREQAHSSYTRDFGNDHNVVLCAVNWDGFSADDILPVVLPSLADVSKLSAAFDRMQQGFVNMLMLGRAMIHSSGLAADPVFMYSAASKTFQDQPNGAASYESVLDTKELYFYGNSQGGIMGGALTALGPDFEQSVLGVPGMNYSTLLRRSVDFDAYSEIPGAGLYDNYPNELERPLLLGLMQMLWDRGEANGYAHHMTSDPYPNTPAHNVLLHPAIGDHQVANITAEVEARTIGARVLTPALDPGRHWESDPFYGIDPIGSFPYSGSALVYWDGGPVGFSGTRGGGTAVPPNENVPPRPENGFGDDPHSYPRWADEGQQQMSDWLRPDGALLGGCSGGKPCYANGYTGP